MRWTPREKIRFVQDAHELYGKAFREFLAYWEMSIEEFQQLERAVKLNDNNRLKITRTQQWRGQVA
jgi:hypothetical protein